MMNTQDDEHIYLLYFKFIISSQILSRNLEFLLSNLVKSILYISN